MKQLLQDLTSGETKIVQAPSPSVSSGHVIIHTTTTLVSAGTERMIVDFSKASYIDKALKQPEKVKMVLEKIKTDGLMTTIEAVQSKLAQPLPLGYCNVGIVSDVGANVEGLKIGDRVVSNAPHTDMAKVSKNLCARIPDNVDDETASFTVIASIGLQGIRLAKPTLGENFVVTGVGLIGLLTVQLLRAHGCRVLAIDFDEKKLQLAAQFGAETCNLNKNEDPVAAGMAFSNGHGVDGVIIAASTQSQDPVTHAARMCRKRGRIILIGVTGLTLNRADFYEKELSFQVSCSYGPGRYDVDYEQRGQDYPYGFVRWTEQRNFEAVLEMMSRGQVVAKPLITHRYLFENATEAYHTLSKNPQALGIVMIYNSDPKTREIKQITLNSKLVIDPVKPVLGIIGAGNYASRVLIPALKAAGGQCHTIVSSGGINSVIHGEKAGVAEASTDTEGLLKNDIISTIVIATRHNSHADLVLQSLKAGKHVFVEKPLALTLDEVSQIETLYNEVAKTKPLHLMVGFNRRFSPLVQKMKALLETVKQPKTILITVNAGALPQDHWTQDLQVGGGRIIGEGCHFIDLFRHLVGKPIVSVQTCGSEKDNVSITLKCEDNSFGTIHYLSSGAASFPKERIEVFAAGRILQLDNFRKLQAFGWPNFKKMSLWRQDKGQRNCVSAFLAAIQNGQPTPIPVDEIFEVSRITINAANHLLDQ